MNDDDIRRLDDDELDDLVVLTAAELVVASAELELARRRLGALDS
jgi:hypothetical protein